MKRVVIVISTLLLALIGCTDSSQPEWTWDLPDHFPTPNVPEDNPMSQEKVDLGRFLFYDTRLSINDAMSST